MVVFCALITAAVPSLAGGAGNNVIVSANSTIASDRAGGSNGNTDTFGNLSIGGINLLLPVGRTLPEARRPWSSVLELMTGNATFNVTNPAGGGATTLTLGAVGDGSNGFGFTKSGNGTLILAGATEYRYSTVSGGVLQAGDGTTNGSLSGDLIDNASVIFNRTDSVSYGERSAVTVP